MTFGTRTTTEPLEVTILRRIREKGFGNDVEMPDKGVGLLPVELEAAGAAAGVGAAVTVVGLRAAATRSGQERARATRLRPCRGGGGAR